MQLVVQIEEHRAVALWGADDGTELLVNSHGEVFEANVGDVEDERLPRLDGPLGSAAMVLAMAQRLQPLLAPLDAGALQALTLSPRGSWRVQLDKGVRLELGRGSDAEVLARAEQFVRTMPRVVATYQRPLESADLRHLGGFAVRLKGITTEVPTADARKRPAG
jgi:cell division protein FtsQ